MPVINQHYIICKQYTVTAVCAGFHINREIDFQAVGFTRVASWENGKREQLECKKL